MRSWQRVPARYYAHLADVVEACGGDSRVLLEEVGLIRTELQYPSASLSMPQVEALVDGALRHTDRADLGLRTARALKLTSHSAVSYGILSSPTAGYALTLVVRFFSLILPAFQARYRQSQGRIYLSITPSWPMSQSCLLFHLDLIAASFHWELGELLGGRLPPYEIRFSRLEPSDQRPYEQLREATIHFGHETRPGLLFNWPAEIALRNTALADPIALKMAEARCRELVDSARKMGNVADWVGMMLRESSGAPPSRAELAANLSLSPRTLDRYLKKEGASFRDLYRQAMQLRAEKLLTTGQMSITQIAVELGFSDAANFTRAFRRETGLSPKAWQAQAYAQHQQETMPR